MNTATDSTISHKLYKAVSAHLYFIHKPYDIEVPGMLITFLSVRRQNERQRYKLLIISVSHGNPAFVESSSLLQLVNPHRSSKIVHIVFIALRNNVVVTGQFCRSSTFKSAMVDTV